MLIDGPIDGTDRSSYDGRCEEYGERDGGSEDNVEEMHDLRSR